MSAFASETTRPMRKYSRNVLCSISSNFTRRRNALKRNSSSCSSNLPRTSKNFLLIWITGTSEEERCDCKRRRTQAASNIVVFPSPLAPRNKLNAGPISTDTPSKQRKLRSRKFVSIEEILSSWNDNHTYDRETGILSASPRTQPRTTPPDAQPDSLSF